MTRKRTSWQLPAPAPLVGAVIPFYAVFLLVMAFAGRAVARLFRLDVSASRAIVFTGATRNSLVVLPLALALPDDLAVAAVVVVTQTLVEVFGMVAYVRAIPCLVPASAPTAPWHLTWADPIAALAIATVAVEKAVTPGGAGAAVNRPRLPAWP